MRRRQEERERKNRGLSSQNRKKCGRKEADRKGKGRRRKRKASTRGTAVGAKRGRTKGNEQRAEYGNLEGRHERSGWRERGKRGSESGDGNCGSHCEAEAGMAERKKQRLSSEMLKRKRTKESGSQALIPEERSKREAPVERLWERNWEGRKETNRKLSKQNRKEADGKPAVDEGEKRRGRKKPEPGRKANCEAKVQRAERKKRKAE